MSALGVSMTRLSVALSLSNSAVKVKHVWNFGWLGCLVAFIICCCSPDSRTRADAAKLVGVGICVSFYVTKHGYFELLCNVFFCEMPLEVLALVTFLVVQCWFWRQKTLSDESSKDSRSETRGVIHGSADPSDEICDDPFGDEEAMEDSSLQGRSTSHVRLPEAHMFPKRRSFQVAIAIIIFIRGSYLFHLRFNQEIASDSAQTLPPRPSNLCERTNGSFVPQDHAFEKKNKRHQASPLTSILSRARNRKKAYL